MSESISDKEKRIRRERQLMEDWQEIYRTAAGKRAIGDLLYWANVMTPIVESDPIKLAIANGERNLAIRLARYLNLTPEIFPATMRENDEVQAGYMGDVNYREYMAKTLGFN